MSTMYFENEQYRAVLAHVPKRSWKWAHRAELRIRRLDDDRPLTGRGCYEGLVFLVEDLDTRYCGPMSKLGSTLNFWGF